MRVLLAAATLLLTMVPAQGGTMEITRVLLPQAVPASQFLTQPLIEEVPVLAIYTAYHHQKGMLSVEGWMAPEDMLEELYHSHREFLVGMISTLETSLDETYDASETDDSSLPDLEWQLEYLNTTGEVLIAGIAIDIPLEVAQVELARLPFSVKLEAGSDNLMEIPLPDYVEFSDEDGHTKTIEHGTSPAPNEYHDSAVGYTPYTGSVTLTNQDVRNTLKFDNISQFYSSSTYEHETIVYDQGFAAQGKYWSSDLPRPYIDCTASLPWEPDKFTIGSMQAPSIRLFRLYNTWIDLTPQYWWVTYSNMQVNGQRGHRIIYDWYNCLNIGADGDRYTCQLTQNRTAPVSFSWTRGSLCLD